ncbi:hypothetical protein F4703DRAFT_1209039 [Phycomyces blakesleeanus]
MNIFSLPVIAVVHSAPSKSNGLPHITASKHHIPPSLTLESVQEKDIVPDELSGVCRTYLGFTDTKCYDLSTDQPLNYSSLKNGLDCTMRRAKGLAEIWAKVKHRPAYPWVLQLRLTDEADMMGNLVISDLWNHPFNLTAPSDSSITRSFSKIRDLVESVVSPRFQGRISTETFILTHVLSEYFCGSSQATVFMHFDEYPKKDCQTEIIDSFAFANTLQKIKSCSTKNKSDIRTKYYRQKAAISLRNHRHEKAQRDQLEIQLECITHNLESKNGQMAEWEDNQKRLENQLRAVYQKSKKAMLSTRQQVDASTKLCEAKERLVKIDSRISSLLLKNDLRLISIERVRERFDRQRIDYQLEKLHLEIQDKEEKWSQDRLALEATYQSDVDRLNELIKKMQQYSQEIELKYSSIKRENRLVQAKETERRWDIERQYEAEINNLQERLHNSMKRAERYFQAELALQMEKEMLQRQNIELRAQKSLKIVHKDPSTEEKSQEAIKEINRQWKEQEKETKRQLTMYKTQAEQFEVKY